MSTPGKVLVAVVILGLVGWVFLFAQIAQLNTNWGKRIDELTTQVGELETGIAQTRATIADRLAETTRSQEQRDKQLTVLRTRLSDVEKLQALNQEAAIRVEQQIGLLNTSINAATTALNNRNTEATATEKLLADTRTEVEQLKAAVAQRFDTLGQLREQFQTTQAENAELQQRLLGSGSSTRGDVRTRPASLSR